MTTPPLTAHQGIDPGEIYKAVPKKREVKGGDFGKRIQPRDFLHLLSSILDPVAASRMRERAKITRRRRKHSTVHCQWRIWASLAVSRAISCIDTFFNLPDTLWAPRLTPGDAARGTGSARAEPGLPVGGDNSSLLELWQFLLVLNPQELLEVITSPSQSIYSCCVFPYSSCFYDTQLIPWWMQFPEPLSFLL